MSEHRRQLIAGLRITGFWTLTSRLLGMVRDMATAALLGLSGSGVMDAFVLAFRIPNLFRRLFGEGALAASYLPVLTEKLERDRADAWRLASVALTLFAVVLVGLVLVGELLCLAAWLFVEGGAGGSGAGVTTADGGSGESALLVGLTALLLPYVLFICLAAQVSATLHALGRFGLPAFVPIVLNVVWIAAAVVVAPAVSDDKSGQAYVLAAAVLLGGSLQLGIQLPLLFRLGFRYDFDWSRSRTSLAAIVASLLPMLLGLAITQINTLADSVLAYTLSAAAGEEGSPVAWLGGVVDYPMRQGATAAIYYGERLYQFPVGMLGIAVATVIFPLLSRHAARREFARIGPDLSLGLRLVLFLSVPAAAGLALLAEPIARLLFERGEFSGEDARRTADMIQSYAPGVWAYCALPVVVRGFYALGNHTTPVRVGAGMVALNLALNLALVWSLAERGLAVATATSAAVQVVLLMLIFSRRCGRLDWPRLAAAAARSLVATVVMTAAAYATLAAIAAEPELTARLGRVGLPLGVAVVVYLAVYALLRGPELHMLRGQFEEGFSGSGR
ncbi:MAG: murein biosynthesis integral membrane protein MurJ [Planctomycetota bacterium]|nr:MAG: murein biosynthesis integral membrane protein MurJ [Planctomycetota bacterium]